MITHDTAAKEDPFVQDQLARKLEQLQAQLRQLPQVGRDDPLPIQFTRRFAGEVILEIAQFLKDTAAIAGSSQEGESIW
jgi:DNA-directed RNA polymerase subunit H (RpoH/RPB5)